MSLIGELDVLERAVFVGLVVERHYYVLECLTNNLDIFFLEAQPAKHSDHSHEQENPCRHSPTGHLLLPSCSANACRSVFTSRGSGRVGGSIFGAVGSSRRSTDSAIKRA